MTYEEIIEETIDTAFHEKIVIAILPILYQVQWETAKYFMSSAPTDQRSREKTIASAAELLDATKLGKGAFEIADALIALRRARREAQK